MSGHRRPGHRRPGHRFGPDPIPWSPPYRPPPRLAMPPRALALAVALGLAGWAVLAVALGVV
jgi:hypothetical protein